MKKIFTLLLVILSFQILKGQTIVRNDSLEIEFKKAKTISNSYLHTNVKMKKTEGLERVLVRCDIKALYKQPVDINAFSLLDTENKIRYRMLTYFGYKKGPSLFSHGDLGRRHLKKKVLNKRGKQYNFLPPYDESVPDSFPTYTFEGYTNKECPMSFNNVLSGEVLSVIYYSPSQKPRFRADMQYVVTTNKKVPKLQLYYGNEFISDVEVKW